MDAFMGLTEREKTGITEDLIKKIGSDVTATMMRTLALADCHLPVAVAGGAAAVGVIGAVLSGMSEDKHDGPDPECILLGALIIGRMGARHADPVRQAYRDFELLKAHSTPQDAG